MEEEYIYQNGGYDGPAEDDSFASYLCHKALRSKVGTWHEVDHWSAVVFYNDKLARDKFLIANGASVYDMLEPEDRRNLNENFPRGVAVALASVWPSEVEIETASYEP